MADNKHRAVSERHNAATSRGFRTAAGKFATGITVVLVETPEEIHGITVNAFLSVSLNPPTLAVSIANHARTRQLLDPMGTPFTVSVLAADQKVLADAFAGSLDPSALPLPFERRTEGPVIRDAAAWFCCVRTEAWACRDHTIITGEVLAYAAYDRDPLLFYEGAYYQGIQGPRQSRR